MTPTMWEPQPRLMLAEAESGGKDAVRCVYACISALGRYVNFCEMDWIVGKFGRGPRSKKSVLAERLTQVIIAATTALEFLGYDLDERRKLMEKVNKENDDRNYW